jgi:protein SCO1/2
MNRVMMVAGIIFLAVLTAAIFMVMQNSDNSNPSGLPIIGNKQLIEKEVDGKKVVDTLDHVVSDFSFLNQEGNPITQKDIEGKIYLVDFFFTHCPTICIKVKKNMKTVYEAYKDNPDFLMLSHSIDPKHDTVARLAFYADKLNVSTKTWHLLTGDKEKIYEMARYQYLITAMEDEDAPGGFDHSGAVALIDKNRKIRGFYDGLDSERMEDLKRDIQLLMDLE